MSGKDFREDLTIRRTSAGIRQEEVCQILNLKKNLDYNEVLIHYAGKYLRMGWELLAVNFKGDPTLDLDFKLSQEIWANQLTGTAVPHLSPKPGRAGSREGLSLGRGG